MRRAIQISFILAIIAVAICEALTLVRAQEATKCRSIAGMWIYSYAGQSVEWSIRPDGTHHRSDGWDGSWTCTGSVYELRFGSYTSRVTLSADGRRMTGADILGPEVFVRKSAAVENTPVPPAAVVAPNAKAPSPSVAATPDGAGAKWMPIGPQ